MSTLKEDAQFISGRYMYMTYLQVEDTDKIIRFEEFEKVIEILRGNKEFEAEARKFISMPKTEEEDARNFFRYMIDFARRITK